LFADKTHELCGGERESPFLVGLPNEPYRLRH
jgi:hypothetical protein